MDSAPSRPEILQGTGSWVLFEDPPPRPLGSRFRHTSYGRGSHVGSRGVGNFHDSHLGLLVPSRLPPDRSSSGSKESLLTRGTDFSFRSSRPVGEYYSKTHPSPLV